MMEAIGQNSAMESKLDAAQNLNNDETNFKLNVVENSPHDDEEDDNDDDDDDDVVEVKEETNKIIAANSQIIEVEDDDKLSQTSSNEANKSNAECDETEVERNVDKGLKRSLEDCNAMQQIEEDEISYQKHLNDNQLNNKCKEIITKSVENKTDENPKVEEEEQNEKATSAEVEEIVDLETAEEQRTIPEVELKDVANAEQNERTPSPHIIDVSQASEDELLKSDDEDVKEQNTKSLENKENSDDALRIEIEDSLDSCNNDSKDTAVVPINDAATKSASHQDLSQTFPVKEDINYSNNETIDVKPTTKVDDEKDVVSISDEESERSIQEEEKEEDKKQQDSAMDVDVDVVEAVNETHRDEVINLDDETQDGLNSVTNIEQQGQSTTTECITINEESQDLVVEQKEQEQLQNYSNNDVMDINENSLHNDEEMQQMQPEDEEKLNGIDENSNEGLRIDLADEDDEGEDKQQYENEQQNLQVSASPAALTNEEQSHATTNDMYDFAIANPSDDGDNLITSIKRQFLKNENSSSVPKLNGEHKNSETDATQTVIDIQADAQTVEPTHHDDDCDHHDDDDDNNDYSSALKIVDERSKDCFSKENSQHSDEASKSPHGQPMLLNASDDEASRFSMASAQSSSTATSSSHQLVIDHQSDDIDPTPPPPQIQTYNPSNTLPFPPFKINLKRKLSQTSDTLASSPPQSKMPHLDFQLQQNDVANEEVTDLTYPILNGENIEREEKSAELNSLSRSSSPVLKIAETTIGPEQSTREEAVEEVSQATDNAESIETPVAAEKSYQTSPARSSPLLNSLLLKKLPLPSDRLEHFTPPQKPNKTKYLCFNCKSGSFNSLVALNEHQHICLANKTLLPEATTSTLPTTAITRIQTPPVSPQQSLEKTISPAHNQQIPETPLEKRRYYQCSSCRTYHENWNLFLHIREIHKRHTCLYCIRMFPTAEKLSLHLEIKHDLEQNHFNSEEALRKSIELVGDNVNEARFLMCCTCQHVFLENENFSDHVCTEYMQACTLCGQKGRHTNQCKAQNEAKRSKVKKKSKARDSTTAAGLPHESSNRQSNPPSVMPQPEYASNMPHKLTTNCDNVQPSPLHATFQPSTTALPTLSLSQQQQHHNEDSNSSCNMVIDETCNSTNYSRSAPYNPFKALDERERLEQQTDVAQAVLPPDRNQILEQAAEKLEPVQPLIVPKFKLRVPKEFQKSVDAAISSTESEDDEELVIQEDDADKQTTSNVSSTPSTTPHMDVDNESLTESAAELPTFQEVAEEQIKQPGDAVEDDDSLDEPNSNLVRILQEIERTKLDIMRTKETLHTSSKTATATPRLATISQTSSRTGEHNWSPTPPASPNSQWYTPRRAISHGEGGEGGGSSEVETKNDSLSEVMPPPPLPIQQERRRNTTGSDVDMDIDETISGQPVQCIERPAHREEASTEKDEAASASTETAVNKLSGSTDSSFADIDVENTSNANMEMEESNKLAPSQQENMQHMDAQMAEQEDTDVVEQALPIEKMQAEHSPSTSDIDTSTKKGDIDIDVCSDKENEEEEEVEEKEKPQLSPPLPADGIIVADDETIAVDLQLDRPLEKFETIEFVRICLKAVYPLCLYCNHARRIAVNGKSLVLHLIAQHRFAATVDSITAEELKPSTIVAKLKSYLPELEEHYFNSNSYCTFGEGAFTHHFNERIFECFQCRFVTSTHKELYLHNRKMHLKTAILCFMCRANFFSFSEILCHVCPGESHKISVFDVKFRCCLCEVDNIPSPFRLMVHLRKKHFACDVCLEDCRDQGRLSSHVWKHKLHHLCYRCGIAYRNKMDITKHLFWKHGTESIICKRCLQKRWRHVYHFCVPPVNFVCDICNLCFSKATYLKVHKRIHTGDLRYPCTDENCEQKFISRRLLLKHTAEHQLAQMAETQTMLTEKENAEQQAESTAHVKDEQSIKIKEEVMEDVNQLPLKNESKDESQQSETKSESNGDKKSASTETAKLTASAPTGDSTSCKQRKKKKNKRNKESLEDLNLIAPNLSESDSSDDTDVESKSKSGDDALVPNVMLSPTSDAENGKEEDEGATKKSSASDASGKVLDIWKNFLQAQGAEAIGDSTEPIRDATDYTEDYYPTPSKLHVAQSDHDYCVMFKSEPPKTLTQEIPQKQISPHKRKTTKSPRHTSTRRSDGSSGSSSGGSSGSSSDSSCSCGSNCSCSSSNSGSSSSSSSSNNSGDSSAASHASRKRHRKKSERDRLRKKSESVSPMKKHSLSESVGKSLLATDVDVGTEISQPDEPTPPKEPLFYESDLETAESETDEEFYDEHPQKLATELLAQKRAQLMAQTRLSPSHNFDIVENSRPSTPSLPDEVARERKVKLKKKKRERKSTSRSIAAGAGVPPLKLNLGIASSPNVANGPAPSQHLPEHLPAAAQQMMPLNTATNMVSSYELMRRSSFGIAETSSGTQQQFNATTHAATGHQLTPRPIGPQHHMGRMSEGSSCSDADASLKRSKRARRPNKFYGYTSDEEHNMSGLGQPLMIGMRAIKPQPPPQLTWRKEDLPTPSKSIINNNNKIKTPRTPKTPNTPHNLQTSGVNLFNPNLSGPVPTLLKKNRAIRGSDNGKIRKRNPKKSTIASKLPPIPTLKIRSSQIGLTPTHQHMQVPTVGVGGTNHIPASQIYSSSKESDDEDDDEEVDSTDSSSEEDGSQQITPSTSAATAAWNNSLLQPPGATATAPVAALILPQVAPAPPPPQAVAFNQKIPPALLPNPDFATLQYFKANNIRYPIRPPAGARQAREGESVYCYCRCPYDEVSEMIACDGENCLIEWFHFECVGIMVAPQGKWFCAECRPKYSEELYPTASTA